ncbi:MAG: cupin domain-containing protein [Candidatus Methanofastidiosia archaeon]
MKLENVENVKPEDVGEFGEKTTIRWLISKKEGARNYAMRYFVMEKGGYIKTHKHPWEHEIFIVKGKGKAGTEKELHDVKPGDFLFIPENESHQYINTFEESLEFICIIPVKE